MKLYVVSVNIRRYDEDFSFISSFIRRVQVIADCESSAMNIAYSAIKDLYERRSGNWTCFPTCVQLLYSNYKFLD